jgi:two-component system, OmpR family, phosphate regulon sensor histidine kinase PhoR
MPNPLRKYLLIIILIFLLPTVFFSIYKIGTLRENERVIEEIYRNQLDAILYSVNQYSEDVLSNWAELIESCLTGPDKDQDVCIDQLILQLPSVKMVYCYDRKSVNNIASCPAGDNPSYEASIADLLAGYDTTLRKLEVYLAGGYRKIESLTLPGTDDQILVFAYGKQDTAGFIVMLHDPVRFINEVLDPKVQQIARDKFYITAIRTKNDSAVYNSNRKHPVNTFEHQRPFWLMKNYSMSIELTDTTISTLARSRSKKDLLWIGVIDLVLLFGVWLIYRNVKKQLELSQLKSDFVSNVSHEIRTPLALITMYIETLEMGRVRSAEKIQEYYKVIQQETRRLTSIVNKILSFSQIESGKRKYFFERTNLNEIAGDVLNSYLIRLEKEGFTHSLQLERDLPEIQADKEAVADAIVNLVDNAIKYSDQNRHLDVATSCTGNYAVISVSDKGIGIPENNQKYIFDKFYRVSEKDLAFKAKGSGLGLTIVKHIMDAHQGIIKFDSKAGEGTIFSLLFPIDKNTRS